jgi:hypothetical protein
VQSLFILALAGATSLAAAGLAWRTGRPGRRWGLAVGRALEALGLGAAFFALNVVVGAAAVLLTRRLSGAFLSAYLVNDVSLLVVSLLQGLVFVGLLRPGRRRRRGPP